LSLRLASQAKVSDSNSYRRRLQCDPAIDVLDPAKKQDLHVICEVADGLDAVRKAEELKPDLILLDIGLPTLNGLKAARQIRELAPESKIIFVSQESSADLVQEALSLGAYGYVVKTKLESDLLIAVGVFLEGRRFVSSGLTTERRG
jgi:DNA-binding NarL/FixJ family response regulator